MRNLGRSLGLLLTLLCGLSSASYAQDFDRAEREFSAAQAAFAKQHFHTAAVAFQAAYEITRDPLLLYNVAESWQKSGNGKKAVASYRAYLKLLPNATDKKEVQSRIAMIEAKNFEIPNQSADEAIPVTPPAVAPATITPPIVAPAPVTPPIVAPAPVTPPPVTPSPAAVAPEAAIAGPTALSSPSPKTELRVPGSNMSSLRVGAWITVAGTVALVTAGAIFGLAAQSRSDEITRRFTYVDPITGQPNVFDAAAANDYRNLKNDGHIYNGLAIGFFAGAGAAAIAATSLFVADYFKEKRSRNLAYVPSVSPTFGQNAGGLSAGWKF